MDDGHFDHVARDLADGRGSRRAVLRFLASGVVGLLASRLGFFEVTEAKSKNTKRKRRSRRTPNDALQAEGKRKGKKGGKKKPKLQLPPPQPPPVECAGDGDCAACERCLGGECSFGLVAPCDRTACQEPVCNVSTNTWECRRTCLHPEAVCCQGQCLASPPCGGGKQLDPSTCQCECPAGQWQCADGSCVPSTQCCAGEKSCPGGVCVSADQCCPGQKRCGDGSCIAEDQCCADAPPPLCASGCQRIVCLNGQFQCQNLALGTPCRMPGGTDGTCCNGQCTREVLTCEVYPYRGWRDFNAETCRCNCADGGVDTPGFAGYCCPAAMPLHDGHGRCFAEGDATNWVCLLGHHYCADSPYPDYPCCRDT
jgi:hypothetical protein